MTDTTLSSLVVIALVATAAPVVSDLLERWVSVPTVVLEIAGGIVIGPVLTLAHDDEVVGVLSDLGLATLMFLAGVEIDLARVRGRPLERAVTGWLVVARARHRPRCRARRDRRPAVGPGRRPRRDDDGAGHAVADPP